MASILARVGSVCVIAALTVVRGHLAAQEARGVLGASAGYFLIGGQDFSGTDNALGVEVWGAYRVAPPLEVGLGIHYSSHGIGLPDRSLGILGVYAEPRVYFGAPGIRQRTFLGARIAWLRRDASNASLAASSGGYGFGAITGVTRAFGRTRIELAISATYLSFATIFDPGPIRVPTGFATPPTPRDTGNAIGIHLAFVLPVLAAD
jgi:hypothetical protein